MDLTELFIFFRDNIINLIKNTNLTIAKSLGYPETPGMLARSKDAEFLFKETLIRRSYNPRAFLPVRRIQFPPLDKPEDFRQVITGCIPKVDAVQRVYYESATDGFYCFYIQHYQNLHTLPSKLSLFIQIHLGYCIDITDLEIFRQVLFFGMATYYEIIALRVLLGWFLNINPYTFPLSYFIALVDWVEDAMVGFVPVILGVNLSSIILMTSVGKFADYLNNLVFTMPYLPGEGVPIRTYVDDKIATVLVYRYLPVLWYKYPIPNVVREYWYYQRPDILRYMELAYAKLNIQFLPDEVINSTLN